MFLTSLRKPDRNLHLVCGISSSGKSFYLDKILPSEQCSQVLMAYEVTKENLNSSAIVHYNLFRPYDNNVENLEASLLDDQALRLLLQHADHIRVTLLVLPRSILAKRILLRQEIEPVFRKSPTEYPGIDIFELLCRIDLGGFYSSWIDLFDEYDIPVEMLDSRNTDYLKIQSTEEMLKVISERRVEEYTDSEIKEVVSKNRFEYQRINISRKQITEGQDRSSTLSRLPIEFKDKSLLDIGCAYGYFCFAAEQAGATRVVGTEQKRHRFIGSNIIKEIKGSRCEFLWLDVFFQPVKEKFDNVLLLNVLHHLSNPIAALEKVASLCNEKLILEFPVLNDEKFQATLPSKAEFDERLPLIGVSLFEEQDQTFVFSSSAIERIIKRHKKKHFSKVEFLPSPMGKNRLIAICTI